MRDEIRKALPLVFQDFYKTFREVACDKEHGVTMCDSQLGTIDFDEIAKVYAKKMHLKFTPKSNDALYVNSNNKIYFIEFKNGSIKKDDIYRKIYDSLIMSIEMGFINDFSFSRDNISYVLVYNKSKYGKDTVLQTSEARDVIYDTVFAKAKKEKVLFDIDKFSGYLFDEVYTYTAEEFKEKLLVQFQADEV